MSWVPLDLRSTCAQHATITACQPSTFMFLQLVVSLLGKSRDSAHPQTYIHSLLNPEPVVSAIGDFQHREEYRSEFDFIIVGAGTAGCTVANRLSQISEWQILLIEAGEEEPDIVDIPSFVLMTQRSSIDWNFRTQPEPTSCKARQDGRCSWPRGKVVGGSSSINNMIYLRGGPQDYNEWERMGNIGWSYIDVLPYFIKSEQNNNIEKVDKAYHGADGEMSIEYFPYQDPNVLALLESYRELGLDIFDQNAERQIGASLLQHYTRDGERVSANTAFLRPIRNKRSNLFVLTNAFVTKVLVNTETKTAYGVEYYRDGKLVKVFAKKEVVVSAGSISTPKILLLSGIGPADYLQAMNINVIHDLNVGQNLHDHATADGPVISIWNRTVTLATAQQQMLDIHKFQQLRRGPLAGTSTIQINSFIQSKFETDIDRPDLQFTIDPVNVHDYYTDPVLYASANIRALAYYNGFMIRPVLLAPKSRGYIFLNDTDPVFGDPLIYPNTFSEDEDMEALIDGTQKILNIINTPSMQRLGGRLVTNALPGCEKFDFGSNDYWRCAFTLYTSTLYHPVGTCKMGPKDDPTAVVNPLTLEVHGVKRLRIMDASIMPVVPRANTNAATVMIAERGVDFIKSDWIKGFGGKKSHSKKKRKKGFFSDDFLDKFFQ